MAQLPRFDPIDVATKSDLAVRRAELRGRLAAVKQRLDRLLVTLVGGTFGLEVEV